MSEVKLDVDYVARLARIALTPEEASAFQSQLSEVLRYTEKLRELELSDTNAAVVSGASDNVFRADEAHEWFTAAEALRNAPRHANDLFVVPKVIE